MTEKQKKALELLDKYFAETPSEQIEAEFAALPAYGVEGPTGADFSGKRLTHAGAWKNYVEEVDARATVVNNARLASPTVSGEATVNYASSHSNYSMAA